MNTNMALVRQAATVSRRAIHTSAARKGFFKYHAVGGVGGSVSALVLFGKIIHLP